ncbi:MAG: thiamine-phosphate kinase [Gemmatimonadota bacterium]|nr:thiamine-phosphate kinase [Gemmatimonadota bacterium]
MSDAEAARGSVELGPGREFDAIRQMAARWGDRAIGIGDDAAVLDLPRGDALVVSVDSAVEDVHFRRGWLTGWEIGYRAAAAALSDLAAMGASPVGMLLAIAIPDAWRPDLLEIADGAGEVARRWRAPILGGNTTRGRELSITTTVLGSVYGPLTRDAVKPGDRLYVTGRLGGSGAALRALLANAEPDPRHREKFARPQPRVVEARWLAAMGATAAIDVSDGLVADLGHLAAASGVRIEVDLDHIPVADGVPPKDAAASGEEYELVVSAPEPLDLEAFVATFRLPLTPIAHAVAGHPGVEVRRKGHRVANPGGYDHFSA